MKEKVLSLKEFVIVLLLACVETAIAVVIAMPFAANLQLVYFLAPGLAGLINGIIYVLLVKKCPKIGTQFIIPLVYGLYFLFSGSVYVFMFFAILAVVNELIMLGGGYGIYLLLTGKKGRKEHFAFGPFLCMGMAVGLLWGQQLIDWYLGFL